MASSMIHLAIVQEMRKKVSFRDINRLFLGVILPDGAVAGNSHFKEENLRKYQIHIRSRMFPRQIREIHGEG